MSLAIGSEQNTDPTEVKKALLRRIGFAFAMNAVHTLICLAYMVAGYFRASWAEFLVIFGVMWLGQGVITMITWTGFVRSGKDPIMTIPWIVWSTIFVVIGSYYVDVFRLSVMMSFFGLMLMGSLRVRTKSFLTLSTLTSAAYAYIVFLVLNDDVISQGTIASMELIQWVIFTLMATSFAMSGADVAGLQQRLVRQNDELSEAFVQIQELAMRDELTGLLNRRTIMDILGRQKALSDSGDYFFVVCYIDLDNFKAINDTYGHGVGDQVLKRFASVTETAIRDVDYAGRLGGEEFVLILTRTALADASIVAERLRASVQATSFTDMHEDLSLTTSIGVTQYKPVEPLEDVLSRADGLLYLAKEQGRNRVCYDSASQAISESDNSEQSLYS